MLINLTYGCSMGCSHCMSDCKKDGEDMKPETLLAILEFYQRHQIPNLVFSGGEMFENMYIMQSLEIIEQKWDRKFPLTFITNGRRLSTHVPLYEKVQDMQRKYGKKMIMIQVTDDPRFYPVRLTEKQKYRLGKLGAFVDTVPGTENKCLYPQGRALLYYDNSWWNTIAPKCANVRLLTRQGIRTIHDIVMTLLKAGKICTPTISPTGEIKLGESALCQSVASIYDTEEEIIDKIIKCQCHSCQYAWEQLQKTNMLAYKMLIPQQEQN